MKGRGGYGWGILICIVSVLGVLGAGGMEMRDGLDDVMIRGILVIYVFVVWFFVLWMRLKIEAL